MEVKRLTLVGEKERFPTCPTHKNILEKQYKKHKWRICGDLKVAAILLDLQEGYKNITIFFLTIEALQKGKYGRQDSP